MLDFYKTQGGRKFIDGTIPRCIEAVKRLGDVLERAVTSTERIAAAMEKRNELCERELSPQKPSSALSKEVDDSFEFPEDGMCKWCHKEEAFRDEETGEDLHGLCEQCFTDRNTRW